ncbi:MAG: NYN domain-containing protein [Patescibacteria group bacterium]
MESEPGYAVQQRAHMALMQHVELSGTKFPLRHGIDPGDILREIGIAEPEPVLESLRSGGLIETATIGEEERLVVHERIAVENGQAVREDRKFPAPEEDWFAFSQAGGVSAPVAEWLARPERIIAIIDDGDNSRGIMERAKSKTELASKILNIARKRGIVELFEMYCDVMLPTSKDMVSKYSRAGYSILHRQPFMIRGVQPKNSVDQKVIDRLEMLSSGRLLPNLYEVIFCGEDQNYRDALIKLKNRGVKVTLVLPTPHETSPLLDLADDLIYLEERETGNRDRTAVRYIQERRYKHSDPEIARRIKMLAVMTDIMVNKYRIDCTVHRFQALFNKLRLEPEMVAMEATDDEIHSGLSLLNNDLKVIVNNNTDHAYRPNEKHHFIEAAADIRGTRY